MKIVGTSKSNKYYVAIYILVIVCLSFPLAKTLPLLDRRWLFQFIGITLPIVTYSSIVNEKRYVYFLIYLLFVVLNFISGDEYFKSVTVLLEEVSYLFIPSALAYIVFKKGNRLLLKWLLISCTMVFVYITAATFVIDQITPGIVRIATGMQFGGDDTLIRMLERIGASNYYLPHALPVLAPALVAGIRSKNLSKGNKAIFLMVFLLAAVLTYLGRGATAILLFVAVSVVAFLLTGKSIKNDIVKLSVVFLLAIPLVNTDLELKTLDLLEQSMDEDNALQQKVRDMRNSILYDEATGDLEERSDLYKQSSSLGFANIVIGTNGEVGGHSGLLDRFATLGIIGFIPYLAFIFGQLGFSRKYLSRRSRSYYLCGSLAALAMLFLKSMSNWEMWFILFCIMPLTLKYIDDKEIATK